MTDFNPNDKRGRGNPNFKRGGTNPYQAKINAKIQENRGKRGSDGQEETKEKKEEIV